MRLIKGSSRPPREADPETFVLPAWTQALLGRDDGLPVRIYKVTFTEGTRMNWHHHDAEQILFGLSGTCMVVDRDGQQLLLGPGDLVVVDPFEEHWHGAAPGADGAHLAINLGSQTVWMEPTVAPF
ncbi:MAG: cupin domain-containing protein [Gemmatimonadota bacterium]